MEESISLEELDAILNAAQKKEHRYWKMRAAIEGFNIDDDTAESPEKTKTQKERFEEVKLRAAAKAAGTDVEHVLKQEEKKEFADLGLDFVEE